MKIIITEDQVESLRKIKVFENYLEKIHRKEAEKFIVRLKHRDLNPLP